MSNNAFTIGVFVAGLLLRLPVYAASKPAEWDERGVIRGEQSEWDAAEYWQFLVDNQKDWDGMWKKLRGRYEDTTPPRVDFKNEVVACVFSGQRQTTGWTTGIAKAADPRDSDHLVVFYWTDQAQPGTLQQKLASSPFAMMKIRRRPVVEFVFAKPYDLAERWPIDGRLLKPAAEVKAVRGAVQLSLSVLKIKVKPAESVWYRIALKNVGSTKLLVLDPVFWDPDSVHTSIRAEFVGRNPAPIHGYCIDNCSGAGNSPPALTDKQHAELEALREAWRKQGLSPDEVTTKAEDFVRAVLEKKRPTVPKGVEPFAWLMPGGEIKTFGRAYNDPRLVALGNPARRPIGDFVEYDAAFSSGTYKMRASYDYSAVAGAYANIGKKASPEGVAIKTPLIKIEVVP